MVYAGENFPAHVGVPLGGKKQTYYMLEVHFDNPTLKSATDTTGLRLHYTNELRANEGGILITGVAPSTLHFIPPHQPEYKTAGYCSLGCTQEVNLPKKIRTKMLIKLNFLRFSRAMESMWCR